MINVDNNVGTHGWAQIADQDVWICLSRWSALWIDKFDQSGITTPGGPEFYLVGLPINGGPGMPQPIASFDTADEARDALTQLMEST